MFVEGHSLFSSDATHDCIAYAFVGLLTKLQVGVLTFSELFKLSNGFRLALVS